MLVSTKTPERSGSPGKCTASCTPILHISNAASLGCFDIQKECFSCDSSVRFVSDYPVIGTYHNIPVCAAIGDNQASVFSALTDKRDLLINIGTGSQISLITDHIIQGTDIEIRPCFEKNYLAVGAGNGIRKNPLLVNAIQEQFHASLRIPKHWEEAAYGAALIAMIASGIRKNTAEAQKLIQYQNENG